MNTILGRTQVSFLHLPSAGITGCTVTPGVHDTGVELRSLCTLTELHPSFYFNVSISETGTTTDQ